MDCGCRYRVLPMRYVPTPRSMSGDVPVGNTVLFVEPSSIKSATPVNEPARFIPTTEFDELTRRIALVPRENSLLWSVAESPVHLIAHVPTPANPSNQLPTQYNVRPPVTQSMTFLPELL